jgi:hypothetical protein
MEFWSDIIKAASTKIGIFALVFLIGGLAIGGYGTTNLEDENYKFLSIVLCLAFLAFGLVVFVKFQSSDREKLYSIDPFLVLMGSLSRDIHDVLKDYLASEGSQVEAESWARLLWVIGKRRPGEELSVVETRASLANQLYEYIGVNSPSLKSGIDSWANNVGFSLPISELDDDS